MKGKNNIILFLIIVLVGLLLLNIYLLSGNSKIVEIKELYSSIIVSNRGGFDLNSTAITFGKVTPGGSSTREILLNNPNDFPIKVIIYGEGDMKKFISPVQEKIAIGEEKKIGITASVPENTPLGEYAGKIIMELKEDD